jgi:hypothetical protein
MQSTYRIRQNGTDVEIIHDGKLVALVGWEAALEYARHVTIVARLAEQWAKAEKTAVDQAILMRAGVPLDLCAHEAIHDEAAKRAQWGRELRLASIKGIPTRERFGLPSVIRHKGQGNGKSEDR